MTIPTYFSHSYRPEDQGLNQKFWRMFAEAGFSFFVDPPSDITIHAHLERMMNRCSAFVAVANQRLGAPFFCSPFVMYEFGLSIQARRPRLILVDQKVGLEPFGDLPAEEVHVFDNDHPETRKVELALKIKRLKKASANFPNRLGEPRKPIAVLAPKGRSRCAYADPKTLDLIKEAARLKGFRVKVVDLDFDHDAYFALDIDKFEAVILDVRGTDLPEWAFAYIFGRLTPTIKLVRLQPHEAAWTVKLPPLVAGLRMDAREPAVESVTYWRDVDDLIFQLSGAFQKLNEDNTDFKQGEQGELYFESIGRRKARLFISNSSKANPLALRLSEALRLRNIEQFQYKDVGAIPTGSNWKDKIRSELRICDVFVALIGEGYKASEWSMEELRAARGRVPPIPILPYKLGDTDVKFVGDLQVPDLPADSNQAVDRVLRDIKEHLAEKPSNRPVRPIALLGGSREVVVDCIRQLPKSGWPALQAKMNDVGVTFDAPTTTVDSIQSRQFAEEVFAEAQRADTEPDREQSAQALLIRALADLSSGPVREVLGSIAGHVPEGRVDGE